MIQYLGEYAVGATIIVPWATNAAAGSAITRATDGGIRVYKNGGTTQRGSSSGITDIEDFDGITGCHVISIDTSDNDTPDFWTSGSSYQVMLVGAIIDGQTVNAWLGGFKLVSAAQAAAAAAPPATSTTFVAHTMSVAQIIRRAARLNADEAALQQRDAMALLDYYEALNEFLQSFCRTRSWWWLHRRSFVATKAAQSDYPLRSQARGAVTFTGVPASGDTITIVARTYTFTTGGDVTISTPTTAALAATNLAAAINGDASRACWAQAVGTVCYLYWAGDDGVGQTLTDSTDAGDIIAYTAFANHLTDFGSLTGVLWFGGSRIHRVYPEAVELERLAPTDGSPAGYCMAGGLATLRIYGSGGGAPGDVYPIALTYQARPSAVLPDGTGQLDWPDEFMDVLPHAIKLLLKAGNWDEAATYGDQWFVRRLAELESFQVDRTAHSDGGNLGGGLMESTIQMTLE